MDTLPACDLSCIPLPMRARSSSSPTVRSRPTHACNAMDGTAALHGQMRSRGVQRRTATATATTTTVRPHAGRNETRVARGEVWTDKHARTQQLNRFRKPASTNPIKVMQKTHLCITALPLQLHHSCWLLADCKPITISYWQW